MKRRIQESYDQIHAPNMLINETKQLVHNAVLTEKKKPRPNYIKPILYTAASIAACACIFILGTKVTTSDNAPTTPIGNEQVDVGTGVDIKEQQFGSVETIDAFHTFLQSVKDKGEQSVSLTKEYTVGEFTVAEGNKTYDVKIQVKGGNLTLRQSDYYLKGTYVCVISEGTNILSTEQIGITDSNQFTTDNITLRQEDMNQDGITEFLLTNKTENSQPQELWYQIQTDGKLKLIEQN